jgi:DNA replicative helicase MCM subunit Mcm2 (Cdc46/Mcm family)
MTINLEFAIATLIPTVVGVFGLYWTVKPYRENQTLKRKDIIFPLIDEFDNSEDLFLARAILDDFSCSVPPFKTTNEFLLKFWEMSREELQYYNKCNLKKFEK